MERPRSAGVTGPIWLFSDEPHVARQALGRYAHQAEAITSPDGPAPNARLWAIGSGRAPHDYFPKSQRRL
jgi:hypothetical protein